MDRRKFLRNGSLLTIGASVLNPFEGSATELDIDSIKKK